MRDATWVPSYPDVQTMAKAIIDAGWAPTIPALITTPEELDNLPIETVVRHENGTVYRKVGRMFFGWNSTDQVGRFSAEHLLESGTIYLLFAPTTT